MSDKNIENKVEQVISEEIIKLGYDLYDVEYVKEGRDFYLRIFIDSEHGIGIEDCEKVNNVIDPILDKKDLIKDQYFLEVSSTGLERNLRKEQHYLNAIEESVEFKLYKKINDTKTLSGILKEYNNGRIKLQVEDELIELDIKDIASAKTIFDW